ncbi:MAG: oligosaccharide flippase family protein [Rhizomicrobium sp.]
MLPDEGQEPSAESAAPRAPQKAGAKTGTLMLRGSVLQFISFGCNVAAGFVLMPVLIHHLGERGYGLWALIGTIVGQLGLLDLGFRATTERFMANAIARTDAEAQISIYSTAIAMFFFLGFVVFLTVSTIALAAPFWLVDRREIWEFEIALIISGLNLAWLFPFAVMQGCLAATYRSDMVVIAQISSTVIRTVLALVAVLVFHFGIIAVAIALFTGSFVQRVLLGFMMHRHLPGIAFRFSAIKRATVKELFGFGRFIFLSKVFDAARYRIDNLIIAPLIGIVAVTHYSVAVRLADYFEALVISISAVSRPVYAMHFTKGEHDELSKKFLTVARLSSSICCVFVALTLVFGKAFVRIWLGPGFDDSYIALSVLVVGMFFALLQMPSRDMLRAIYKHQFDTMTNGIEVIANLILTVVLILRFGIVGAALGTVIPMLVIKAGVLPVYVCRTLDLNLFKYWIAIGRPIVIAAIFSAAIAGVFPVDEIHGLVVLAGGVATFTAVLVLMLLLGSPDEDKAVLVRALGKGRIERIPGGYRLLRSLGI